MRADNINLPIVAIGGITFADISSVMQTGVTGIALSGTVLRADKSDGRDAKNSYGNQSDRQNQPNSQLLK